MWESIILVQRKANVNSFIVWAFSAVAIHHFVKTNQEHGWSLMIDTFSVC